MYLICTVGSIARFRLSPAATWPPLRNIHVMQHPCYIVMQHTCYIFNKISSGHFCIKVKSFTVGLFMYFYTRVTARKTCGFPLSTAQIAMRTYCPMRWANFVRSVCPFAASSPFFLLERLSFPALEFVQNARKRVCQLCQGNVPVSPPKIQPIQKHFRRVLRLW